MTPAPARDAALDEDLEGTLRLLGDLIRAVQAIDTPHESVKHVQALVRELQARPQLQQLPTLMLKVHQEITQALDGIRATRETIQTHSLSRIKDTHARLTEVSSTSENAAIEMLNGLDRSLALIDQIEQGGGEAKAGYDALRDEVNALYGHLQFQDIIAQQLHGVTALLAEIEHRMQTVATLFDEAGSRKAVPSLKVVDAQAYNADARFDGAAERQAAADALISAARGIA